MFFSDALAWCPRIYITKKDTDTDCPGMFFAPMIFRRNAPGGVEVPTEVEMVASCQEIPPEKARSCRVHRRQRS